MLVMIIIEILIGAFCGFVADKLMKGNNGFWKNVLLGLAGGLVGGIIGNLLGVGGGWVTGILLSIGGACLVVWLFRKLFGKG